MHSMNGDSFINKTPEAREYYDFNRLRIQIAGTYHIRLRNNRQTDSSLCDGQRCNERSRIETHDFYLGRRRRRPKTQAISCLLCIPLSLSLSRQSKSSILIFVFAVRRHVRSTGYTETDTENTAQEWKNGRVEE